MPPHTLAVAPCQYELGAPDSIPALCDRAESLLDEAGPADVYVLPELFAVDATGDEGEGPAELALDARECDRFHEWCAEAAKRRDALVVGGSYYVRDDGVRNRCPVALPDGTVRTYDKRHPIPGERDGGVRPGDDRPPVVEHEGVGVGVLVCYDVEFPETVRDVVDRGAELLAVPSWTAAEAGFQRVRRCSAARAVENQCYVVQTCLVGEHPREAVGTATGRSTVYAPCDDVVGAHGTRLSLPRDEAAAATCRLDVDALRASRERASVRPYADRDAFDAP